MKQDTVNAFYDAQMSYFDSCKNPIALGVCELPPLIDAIITGRWKSEIEEIRETLAKKGKKASDKLKEKLHCLTLSQSGNRTKNKTHADNNHTSFVQLDGDLQDNPGLDLDKTIKRLKNDPHICAGFRSPSLGLKLVGLIPPSRSTHKQYYQAFARYLKQKYDIVIDPHCSDIGRPCFVSYDPDAWIRKDVEALSPLPLSDEQENSFPQQPGVLATVSPALLPVSVADTQCPTDLDVESLLRKMQEKDQLRNQFEERYPKYKTHYQNLVREKTMDFKSGTRHATTISLVNSLYQAIEPKMIETFLDQFWSENQENIKATLSEHRNEYKKMLDTVELVYLKTLKPIELQTYVPLAHDYRMTFRICRSLALLKGRGLPGQFHLSSTQLESRTGISSAQGHRILKYFTEKQIIHILVKGKQGLNQPATTYQWILTPVPSLLEVA